MNGLTRLAIHRPVTMLMIILSMLLMGVISFQRLPVQHLPTFTFPNVQVVVRYPGASPNDVFQTVTRPIENAVSTVGGINQVSGSSSEGTSRVSIQFAVGTDVNVAANDVAQVVNRIQSQLPAGTQAPSIIKANPGAFPILNLALSGNLPRDQLYDLATNILQPSLEQVPGVAAVDVQGGLARQVNVAVKPGALVAQGIALDQVVQAIRTQNLTVPGGTTTLNERTLSVRTEAYYQSAEQLQDLVLVNSQQAPVLLKQVADVQVGSAPVTRYARVNGEDAVGLSITAQDGANIVEVAKGIKERLGRLAPTLSQGTTVTIINDQSSYTEESMNAVLTDLILVILLPGLVLLLFLHRFRNTFIVMCAIPTSMISSFIAMYFLGLSLDTISLLALSLCTGILVDDSIVVLENINRHLGLGKHPEQAALDGRVEIGLAALAITLTDIVVYLPIAFTSGLVGRLFREFGLVIAAATLLSLFVSFTLTPLLAARWLKKGDEEAHPPEAGRSASLWERFIAVWERGYGRVQNAYGRWMLVALRHRPVVVLVGVVSLGLSLAFLPLGWLTTEFTPQTDNSQFSVNVQMPIGTALSRTDEVVRRLDEQIRAL
ncbi:MAG: efflux RND transporter permease subunit, partial [Chloroflexi bacterium]|nr:efflux RND transporter permease subunit [Chloroflexota bacterium]